MNGDTFVLIIDEGQEVFIRLETSFPKSPYGRLTKFVVRKPRIRCNTPELVASKSVTEFSQYEYSFHTELWEIVIVPDIGGQSSLAVL